MADRSEVLASAAYAALKPNGRRVLRLIEDEIERGTASLSLDAIEHRLGCSRATARFALKEIVLCGFVSVSVGVRRVNTFALADGWRALDAVEAKRLVGLSKLPMPLQPAAPKPAPRSVKPKPAPQPVEPPRTEQRRVTVTLAKLSFMDDGR
jgi:hypothetical protein